MPTLIFVWLFTATAGALYLGKRLGKDYHRARTYQQFHLFVVRHRAALRLFESMMYRQMQSLKADETVQWAAARRVAERDVN